jgi:hypothetical protein
MDLVKNYIPRYERRSLLPLVACLLILCGCSSSGGRAQPAYPPQEAPPTQFHQQGFGSSSKFGQPPGQNPQISLDDAQLLYDQANQLSKVEVTAIVQVKKLLPDDTRGLQHQKFLLILSNGSSVLVANDLTYGQRVPIQPGDIIKIHGEYIWNKLGGLIHWTHRSDTPRHESGWIECNGIRYQ